jgi:plastocyanin
MRGRVVVLALALLAGAASLPGASAAPVPGVVEVHNNFFDPQTVRIEPGGTVRWTVVDGGHTITADDGRFDFPASGTLAAGESVSWTAAGDEVVRYHCKIHDGEGMVGSIVVGDGGVVPPPAPSSVLRVPAEYPTVAAAVAAATEGSVVKVAAGVYDEAVEVTTPRITIEGEGDGAEDVVFEGRYRRAAAITGKADGLVVRGVSARRYLDAGIRVEGAGSVVEDVAAVENEGAGVLASGAGTVVRRSRLERNGAGVVVAGAGAGQALGPIGFDVLDNAVVGGGPRPDVGIWVDGAWGVRVTGNDVGSTRLGILVAAGSGVPRQVDVVGNQVGSSAAADLAYDGLGVDVCFADNGPQPTTEPPSLMAVSDCGSPHVVGLPDPLVHVALRAV